MKISKNGLLLISLIITCSACSESASDSYADESSDAGPDASDHEQDQADSGSPVERPDGWTLSTHSKDGGPDYETVFPQNNVNRIDLIFEQETWEAMLADATDKLGEFAASYGINPFPDEWIESCESLNEYDRCQTEDYNGDILDGTCISYGYDEELVCYPDYMEIANAPPASGVAPILVPRKPEWFECTVSFNSLLWPHVGIRFKGNSTLANPWATGSYKLPFKLDFDEFEQTYPEVLDQRFYGFRRISFANNARDSSYHKEKAGGDLFRNAGVPTPARAFYRVFIDIGYGPVYFGLYTMAEIPGKHLAENYFGRWGGNLYKPKGLGASWTHFVEETFPKKANKSDEDFSDIKSAIDALNADRSDADVWRLNLEQTFNVDGFLKWLAINTVIGDWDTYGFFCHNYYLYGDPDDNGRLNWIPWDHNESLKPAYHDLDFSQVDNNFPLIRYLIDDEVYHEIFLDHVRDFIDGAFSEVDLIERLEYEHELIRPYVIGDYREQAGFSLIRRPEHFEISFQRIIEHIRQRHVDAREFLSGSRNP